MFTLAHAHAVLAMDEHHVPAPYEPAWETLVAIATARVKLAARDAKRAARASAPLRDCIIREDA